MAWKSSGIMKKQKKYNEAQRELERAEEKLIRTSEVGWSKKLLNTHTVQQRPGRKTRLFGLRGPEVDAIDYWYNR
jgi:hypothetical protein